MKSNEKSGAPPAGYCQKQQTGSACRTRKQTCKQRNLHGHKRGWRENFAVLRSFRLSKSGKTAFLRRIAWRNGFGFLRNCHASARRKRRFRGHISDNGAGCCHRQQTDRAMRKPARQGSKLADKGAFLNASDRKLQVRLTQEAQIVPPVFLLFRAIFAFADFASAPGHIFDNGCFLPLSCGYRNFARPSLPEGFWAGCGGSPRRAPGLKFSI